MIIAGRRKWEILLKYYPPWDGSRLKRNIPKKKISPREVLPPVNPSTFDDLPEDVRQILKALSSEGLFQA